MASRNAAPAWDVHYEWKAVALLSLGFALVGLDRFMILPMFPAVAWGVAALFAGRISDLLGRRKLVLLAIVVFSLPVGISGLTTGLLTLLVRAAMGVADGAYTPPGIVATLEASHPRRHGLNLGIEQMMLPLFGLAFAPVIVTPLLQAPDWRSIFVMVISSTAAAPHRQPWADHFQPGCSA